MVKTYLNNDLIKAELLKDCIKFNIPNDCENSYISAEFEFDADNEYVFFPACAYNGNKFDVMKKAYPPMFDLSEASVDMPVTITDVPRLNKDGSGIIEVTAGDVSVPCAGLFMSGQKRGILLFTIQQIDGINLGISYEKGKITVSYPHMRRGRMYCANTMVDSEDKGISFKAGQQITIPYKLIEFECDDLNEFYKMFFENRKVMGLDCLRPDNIPPYAQFEIQKNKFNTMNFRRELGCYGVGTENDAPTQVWQPGWVGGAMSSYALMKLGGEFELKRAMSTLEFLFSTQTPSGFFWGIVGIDGKRYGDFVTGGDDKYHLIRKSADILYFLFKHFEVMRDKSVEIPVNFIDGTRKLSDAFVKLWNDYGQFGQFVHTDTGELAVGGSTSAGIAPAGLTGAYKFFGDEIYLDIAKKSAELYYSRDVKNGYTTGGPGEILQCPDSESAFGLLESFVELYDVTREDKWLCYAETTARQCSSWVVAYNYKFPETSEFGRLDMKTTGTVFANVQNKHSAPGICTLSGNSLYKLYEFTNNELYLELLEDIAAAIPQYMSTDSRPVYSWDEQPQKLTQGFINERVNMSDWEGTDKIGGVFNGSCWSETANLLTLADEMEWRRK